MNRRGFLGGILALAASPAIVRAESLMAVRPSSGILAQDGALFVFGEQTIEVWSGGGGGGGTAWPPGITAQPMHAALVREALRMAHAKLSFIGSIDREYAPMTLEHGGRIKVRPSGS